MKKKGMEFTMSTIVVIIILLTTTVFILRFLAVSFPAATAPLSDVVGEVKNKTGGTLIGCGNNIVETYLGEVCDGTQFSNACKNADTPLTGGCINECHKCTT